MSSPGTIVWFARHESRLAWRDWVFMMTAGRRWRTAASGAILLMLAVGAHAVAYVMLARYAETRADAGVATLLMLSASMGLSLLLIVSQAMESVTRAFYARSDLELILSSPTSAHRLFAVRIATIALSVSAMAMLVASPAINVLVATGGARWLAAYGVVAAMGCAATAIAVAVTVGLFAALGPKRTRLVAQVVAAIVGASFIIGLQIAAILSSRSLSCSSVLQSDAVLALAPSAESLAWLPARAVLGDGLALVLVIGVAAAMLVAAILAFAPRFAALTTAAAGVSHTQARVAQRPRAFTKMSARRALRHKEWVLLRRDPWLLSQTLMQLLYLVPPALLLWYGYGANSGVPVVATPLLVMAAGQLAGGLAWLAISGEDAPDLVATAPVPARELTRAKVEAVMLAIAVVFAPFIVLFAWLSLGVAAAAAGGIAIAALSSVLVQLWFRAQAKRSHFRRRQTSSRVATFAEAFSSISWAAAAALAAVGSALVVIPVAFALIVLASARFMRPAS